MKITTGLLLAAMLATSAMAQTNPSELPALPPPPPPAGADAPAKVDVLPQPTAPAPAPAAAPKVDTLPQPEPAKPAPKKAEKSAPKKAAATAPEASAPLTSPEPAMIGQNNVNVRGKAAINSEVVSRLTKGDRVTILEEITLKNPKTDEPAKWAKIAYPTNATVWIHGMYIDPATKTVSATKLNTRTGPGENYSVVGSLENGATVKEISAKGEWMEIEPPANAYAFVAAHLLDKNVPPPPAPVVPAVVENPTPVAPAPDVTPVVPAPEPAPAPAPEPPVANVPPPIAAPVEPEPTTPRIVSREGIVADTVSIQAPSYYRLRALDSGRSVNYLYSSSTNLVLRQYRGLRVIVTGEEGLDERWPNTPVLTIQKIQVVE